MKSQAENSITLREEIIASLDNPRQLEKVYRENKTNFKKEFKMIYPRIQDKTISQIWNERLNFENEDISWGTTREWTFIIIASIISGLIAKIAQFASIDPEFYYTRNLAFVVFPMLSLYFAWRQQLPPKRLVPVLIAMVISAIYINLLPNNPKSDTLMLACIHMPLFMWALLGFTYTGGSLNDYTKRLDFLRFNGDLVVMGTIIAIAGMGLSMVTIGLFKLIDLNIGEFYFENIAIWGLASLPLIATYLVLINPQLVNKVSPVIARVFTPLVLIMLVAYVIAVIYTGKDPYNDREFLMVFNLLIIGVMAIIFFSIAELAKNPENKTGIALLFCLSIVTILVNGYALSAIVFRISSWGITPNRLAVLGANILMLTNLLLVTYKLFNTIRDKNEMDSVEKSIATFLPVYILWSILVTFVFPVVFSFK
ncbi:MAG: hypothetical protein ABI761_16950 [Saprospiraceae bacterium]